MVAPTADLRPRTHRGIRTIEEVTDAAAAFRRVAREPNREHGVGGREAYLSVGPGRLKLGTRTIDTMTPLFGVSREVVMRENGRMTTAEVLDDDAPRRGKITGWSQKSRNRMRDRLGSLDYSPMFRPGRQLPKMVTLTMPHRWETVAPTAQVFKRRLIDTALKKTFRRHWGYDLVGVWKLEFQDRKQCRAEGCHDPKAPHLHILMAPPSGDCPQTGESFETWLRMVWSKACADAATTEDELHNHRAKGVHIEDTYGLTGTDSKRIADYFTKHGVFAAKEYQNQPPAAWASEDGTVSPGRYWGYWGMKAAEGVVALGAVEGPETRTKPDGRFQSRTEKPITPHYVK